MESPIYTVPGLTRIVRVVPIKIRFSFIHESMAEMVLFSISRPVVCVISSICVLNFGDALWKVIISGDIHGVGGLFFMDFDLTGVCLSSKVLSVVWYCSHNCDKSALGLVISSHFTISSLNARMSMS